MLKKGFVNFFTWLTPVFFVAVLVAAPYYRAFLVEDVNGDKIRCLGCFYWQVVRADSPILLLGAILLFLAFLCRASWLSFIFRLLLVCLTFTYVFDIYVFDTFNNRLYLGDIERYFSPELVAGFSNSYLFAAPGIQVATALSVVLCLGYLCLRPWRRTGTLASLLVIYSLVLLGWHLAAPSPAYVHGWAIESAFKRNLPTGERLVLSDENLARYDTGPVTDVGKVCSAGLDRKPNIILLIIESWSSWQSKHFSGLEDWTPELDAIAQQHLYNKAFYANGYKTEEGLIAFFTGLQPMPSMRPEESVESYHAFRSLEQTLPTALAAQGYQSLFITSGDLAFSGKRDWLESLAFDYLEGYEYPGYQGLPRFTFGAVADAVLYSRILALLTGDPQKERFRDLWPGGLTENNAAATAQKKQANARYRSFPFEVDVTAEMRRAAAGYFRHTGQIQVEPDAISIEVDHSEPYFTFPGLKLAGDRDYQLEVTLETPVATTAQLYFKSGEDSRYSERYSLAAILERGESTLVFNFAIDEAPGSLRFDPGYSPGRYRVKSMKLSSKPRADRPAPQSVLQPGKPYFLAIETVSTHQPFTDPMTFEKSFKAPFVYADKAAGEFYRALVEADFFDNGILVITSDHRSMTPLSAQEIALFGLSAHSRVPIVVAAPMLERRGEISGTFQQRDLLNSLLHVASEESCAGDHVGNFLAEPARAPRCILHHRGDRRDHVDYFCGEAEGSVLLDGDDTRAVLGDTTSAEGVIEAIHQQRTRAYLRAVR